MPPRDRPAPASSSIVAARTVVAPTLNVALEAQALGTFVVAASVGGLPEAIAGPGTGALVHPNNDTDEFVSAVLDALAGDGTDRQTRCDLAEEFLMSRFSGDSVIAGLTEVYRLPAGRAS